MSPSYQYSYTKFIRLYFPTILVKERCRNSSIKVDWFRTNILVYSLFTYKLCYFPLPEQKPVYFSKFLFQILRQISISLSIKFQPARPDPTDVSSKLFTTTQKCFPYFNARNNQTLPQFSLYSISRGRPWCVVDPLYKH